MQTLKISRDMSAATMGEMKIKFEALAASAQSILLDLGEVEFIDSSGIGGIVFLFKRLRERSLTLTLANVRGQPLRLIQELQLGVLLHTTQ